MRRVRRSHLRKDYGYFKPSTRFAADQVPMEVDQCKYTLNDKGSKVCFVKGTKKDITKRLATIQLCVRLEGDQVMKPCVIMRNANPCEDRFELPDGLKNRLVDFMKDGQKKREDEWYDDRVVVMWDPKAWFSQDVAYQWYEKFIESTHDLRKDLKRDPSIVVQQDNLETQNVREIKKLTWEHGIFITNTSEDCTDVLALIDHHLGVRIKTDVSDQFWKEFEKSEESIKFFCDEITEAEWRIRYTKWIGVAWDNLLKDKGYIMKMAKEVGYCNCICGCENHLVKLLPGFEYHVREKNSEKTQPLTKEEIQERMETNKKVLEEKRIRRRRRLMRKRIEKSRRKEERLIRETRI